MLARNCDTIHQYHGPGRRHARTDDELLVLRRVFDGIRYKVARDAPWSHIPHRYGTWPNLYHRYVNDRNRGDFARMLSTLRGRPEAERVVRWLEEVT